MKNVRFLWVILVLLMSFSTQAEALSPEAQALVEQLRIRVAATEATDRLDHDIDSLGDVYIPGRELEAALRRARAAIYRLESSVVYDTIHADNQPESLILYSEPATKIVETEPAMYVPGSLLAPAMRMVREERRKRCSVEMVYQEEASFSRPDESAGAVLFSEAYSQPAESVAYAPVTSPPESEAIVRTDEQYRETPPFVAPDAVERLRTRIEQRRLSQQVSASEVKAEHSRYQSDSTGNISAEAAQEIQPRQFNEFISRYEYKMPSNYRIIVR